MIRDLKVIPPTTRTFALAAKVSLIAVVGKVTPLVILVINRDVLAPEMYPPEPAGLAVVIDK